MAVCSYLVFPAVGEREAVHAKLTEMPGCDVVPSTNRDVLMLITDTCMVTSQLSALIKLTVLANSPCSSVLSNTSAAKSSARGAKPNAAGSLLAMMEAMAVP